MPEKRYFSAFDSLRFLAFSKVFFFHIPIASFPLFGFMKKGGGIGVIFFFVLSGFLITYIIAEEKSRTGKLNLQHFFVRRALRIWPLYYAMILFAFLTPHILDLLGLEYSTDGYEPNWLMSLAFLENYKMIMTDELPNVSPLVVMWSLCIEEHFYLVWGLLLYFFNIKRLPYIIAVSIVLSSISRYYFSLNGISPAELLTNPDYFAFGAIPAYLVVSKGDKLDSFINRIPMLYKRIIIAVVILYTVLSPSLSFPAKELLEPIIFCILFSSVLFIVAPANSSFSVGETNILSRLGIYTYGLYIFHTIVISLFVQIFRMQDLSLELPFNAFIFVSTAFTVTLILSVISYHLFEDPFNKFKKTFLLM